MIKDLQYSADNLLTTTGDTKMNRSALLLVTTIVAIQILITVSAASF